MKILIRKGTIRRPIPARIENETNYYRHIHHEQDHDPTGFGSIILFEDFTTRADISAHCSISAKADLSDYVLVDVKLALTL